MDRVLRPGGKLVIVPGAHFHNPLLRFIEWVYLITGQRRPQPAWEGLLDGTGMSVRYEEDRDGISAVQVIVAARREVMSCES